MYIVVQQAALVGAFLILLLVGAFISTACAVYECECSLSWVSSTDEGAMLREHLGDLAHRATN